MFAAGKNVIIVGGGDTGNDCTATSIRQGAKSVIQLEMMPCPPSERAESNPWPEWPKTLKTDYGQEEAIALFGHDPRIYETTVKSVETKKDGSIKSVTTVKVRFENRKMVEVEGSEKTYPCDMLLIAAGFVGCEDYTAEAFNIKRTQRNVAETAEGKYATSVPGVFAAGDMRRGQSLVVWGIVEGRSAAREVDEYLMGYSGLA
jgi:glutamate synthase (NADPH/NADH) small chain